MKQRLFNQAKEQSKRRGHASLNYKTNKINEFFHFIHGALVEYQLNKYKSVPIKLTSEEKKIINWRESR